MSRSKAETAGVGSCDQVPDEVHWVKTVGAPVPNDPRDGEVHQFFGPLPRHFDLEPQDGSDAPDAHYVRSDVPPDTDGEGRTVWIYEYRARDAEC